MAGRRARGFVVAVDERPGEGLKSVLGISGSATVFDGGLLEVLRWASFHYVAPLSVMLERAAPPNLPPEPGENPPVAVPGADPGPFVALAEALVTGGDVRAMAWMEARPPVGALAGLASELVARGGTLLVIVATVPEASNLAGQLSAEGGEVVAAWGDDRRELTRAWSRLRHRGGLAVGTPRTALWPLKPPAAVVVVEEGRRSMKDRQTPTVHVRELVIQRIRRQRIGAVFCGPTPSLEVVASGVPRLRPPGRRLWPLVEVIDRNDEPPGSGLLTDRVRRALQLVVRAGGRAFVYAHRRGYAAATRCVACKRVRRCIRCGSRPDPGESCGRCGTALGPCTDCGGDRFEPLGAGVGRVVESCSRVVGAERCGVHPTGLPVAVGTERDLVDLEPFDLVVLVDIDGLIFGTNYRAAEEALRIGVRLATRVAPGGGHRLQVQTSSPDHPVVAALRSGTPEPFYRHELEMRRRFGYPPFGQLLTVELRGAPRPEEDEVIRRVDDRATVLGPAVTVDGLRWLVQGEDLTAFRIGLRRVVQRWRDAGLTVRIDADPIDL